MIPCKSTAEDVLFKWSHHRVLSTLKSYCTCKPTIDTVVERVLSAIHGSTQHVSIVDSGSLRVQVMNCDLRSITSASQVSQSSASEDEDFNRDPWTCMYQDFLKS